MATNLYGRSCTPNLGGVQDYYTKAEVNQLLSSKLGPGTVYTKTYIDGELALINATLSSLSTTQVTESDLTLALNQLQDEIETGVEGTYATLAGTYSKSEVDSLISAIDLDPATLIKKTPSTTAENTINPGANNAIALTIRGSSTNAIVSEWRDSSGDRIGYVSNSGPVVFENTLTLGRLVSDGSAALNMSGRRVENVAPPTLGSDAVPLSYLQNYILDFYEEVIRPEPSTYYSFDAGTY